ncbi:hypothetical protein H5T87_11195 [bacterium]|nr:hypothetical protein [bacterium]
MSFVEEKIVYFKDEENWEENTAKTVELVREFLKANPQVKHLVVASSRGYTAERMARALPLEKVKMVVVKLAAPRDKEFNVEFDERVREYLSSVGVPIVEATHTLSGAIDVALLEKFKIFTHSRFIAEVLYLFSQGMKVCLEIASMAVDAGLLPEGVDALCVAGTGFGADTAVLLQAEGSSRFFDIKVKRILCMPE